MATPTLSREEMLDIIAKGGSICFNGVIVTDPAYIPTEAQMAKGNPQAEADAQAKLEAQIAALQAQMDALRAPAPVASDAVAPEEVAPEEVVPPEDTKGKASKNDKVATDSKDEVPEDAKP